MKLSHLYFKNSTEGIVEFKQLSRGGDFNNEDVEIAKDYTLMRQNYDNYLKEYKQKREDRKNKKDKSLGISTQIDYIYLHFFDTFTDNLEKKYKEWYGITPVKFENFNKSGLFVVVDTSKFKHFIHILESFIALGTLERKEFTFIESFEFLTIDNLLQTHQSIIPLIYIETVDNIELDTVTQIAFNSELIGFLKSKNIQYNIIQDRNIVEVFNLANDMLSKIIENFDIVYSLNSIRTAVIAPSKFGTPQRDFGFTINIDNEVPIIGIIDTGVSNVTPLKDILINENNSDFDLTNTNSALIDNVVHGTSVAALAALGVEFLSKNPILTNHAKLLSIKAADSGRNICISAQAIIKAIKEANNRHQTKIFVLTLSNHSHKDTNEAISLYAYWLDKLAFELDIMLFISVTNNNDLLYIDNANIQRPRLYPSHFLEETSNLASPAESLNNMTIGALADNNDKTLLMAGLSIAKENPACYSRKFHLNYGVLKQTQKNKHLFKPDVLHYGGDYKEDDRYGTNSETKYALTLLDNSLPTGFYQGIGTSFSAPLVANIAAQILKKYPTLQMQSIKALIINNSEETWTDKSEPQEFKALRIPIKNIIGHGFPNLDKCLNSSENEVTYILEDSIEAKKLKVYPINFPHYLNMLSKQAILEVHATLCFKFNPVYENQLAYCPIHIGFTFCKNLPIENINNSKMKDIRLNSKLSWSQDYYVKSKLLSNVQKMSFNIQKERLISEQNTIKIAISSKIHGLLSPIQKQKYENEVFDFSLVIRIKEKDELSTRLYGEMQAINITEIATQLDTNLEVEL